MSKVLTNQWHLALVNICSSHGNSLCSAECSLGIAHRFIPVEKDRQI